MAITTELPQVSKEGRYTVHQAAEALCVSDTQMRRYISRLNIRTGRRKNNGHTFIKGSEIQRLWLAVI